MMHDEKSFISKCTDLCKIARFVTQEGQKEKGESGVLIDKHVLAC